MNGARAEALLQGEVATEDEKKGMEGSGTLPGLIQGLSLAIWLQQLSRIIKMKDGEEGEAEEKKMWKKIE